MITFDPTKLEWVEKNGKDRDGDSFHEWVLVYDKKRIVGKIHCPMDDEYWYSISLFVKVKDENDLSLYRSVSLANTKSVLWDKVVVYPWM